MAFNPQQIYPIDLNTNVAVGVNLPFSDPAVFKSNYLTKDSTKNNIINYFLTNPGERPLNPSFGGGLRNFIFEQIANDTLDGLKETISLQLQNVFPNVTVNSIDVLKEEDTYGIIVKIKYSINNTNIVDNIQLQF
jgi:phage baseplate assembly protein W